MGRLPKLVGALGVVERSLVPRQYKLLDIRLVGAFTYNAGLSPFREVFGDPVEHIIGYARPRGGGSLLTMSVPSEFWTNLTQREEILGMSKGDPSRLSSKRIPGDSQERSRVVAGIL